MCLFLHFPLQWVCVWGGGGTLLGDATLILFLLCPLPGKGRGREDVQILKERIAPMEANSFV